MHFGGTILSSRYVAKTLKKYRPDVLAKEDDRTVDDIPQMK
jgi:hypothetical protein